MAGSKMLEEDRTGAPRCKEAQVMEVPEVLLAEIQSKLELVLRLGLG